MYLHAALGPLRSLGGSFELANDMVSFIHPVRHHDTHSSVGVSLILGADFRNRLGTRVCDSGDVSEVAITVRDCV